MLQHLSWAFMIIVIIKFPTKSFAQEISSYAVDPYDSYQDSYVTYEEVPFHKFHSPRQFAKPRSFWTTAQDITSRAFNAAQGFLDFMWVPLFAVIAFDAFVPRYRHFRAKRDIGNVLIT